MKKKTTKHSLLQILLIVLGLGLTLLLNSLIVGWNPGSYFLYWFIVIPTIAVFIPGIVSRKSNHLLESIVGVLLFYGLMWFMTFELTQTDFVKGMLVSGVVNLIVVSVAVLSKHPRVNQPSVTNRAMKKARPS